MAPEIKPQIIAHFEMDEQGNPLFVKDGNVKHYNLMIEVENSPPEAYAATFELYEDFYDPVQTLRPDRNGRFSLKTTSYGDYDVKVRLRTKEGDIPIADTLARALRRSYAESSTSPALKQAIVDLGEN
jgi:hypothetical protein